MGSAVIFTLWQLNSIGTLYACIDYCFIVVITVIMLNSYAISLIWYHPALMGTSLSHARKFLRTCFPFSEFKI